MDLDVRAALHGDLDQRGFGAGGAFEALKALGSHVGDLVDGRDPLGLDAERCAEEGLELLALELLGLWQELEDPAAVVVEDDDPDRRVRVPKRGESV